MQIEVDASPWGGGAVLRRSGLPVEFWAVTWTVADAQALQTQLGQASGQTSWELLAILVALCVWGRQHRVQGIAILGDNVASLEAALHLKGKNALSRISREIAWRRCREGWRYVVGHLPSERNVVADALSRLAAPREAAKQIPPELGQAKRAHPPKISDLWVV